MARNGGRLDACASGTSGVIDRNWQSRRARAIERTQTACLLSGRTRGLHISWVSLYYYLLVLKAIFVDASSLAGAVPMEHIRSDSLQGATVAVLAAGVVFLGLTPNLLISRILAAIP